MPTDIYTELNCGVGGSIMDEFGIDYGDVTPLPDSCAPVPPGTTVLRRRAKVVLAGSDINEISSVKDGNQVGNEYALIIKQVERAYDSPINYFSSVSGIAADSGSGAFTTVASYTVPVGKTFVLHGFNVSGDVNAKYKLTVDNVTYFLTRTSATNLSSLTQFNRPPLEAGASSIVKVEVIYYSNIAGISANFEATIMGYIF